MFSNQNQLFGVSTTERSVIKVLLYIKGRKGRLTNSIILAIPKSQPSMYKPRFKDFNNDYMYNCNSVLVTSSQVIFDKDERFVIGISHNHK